jgi:hypothetical protein
LGIFCVLLLIVFSLCLWASDFLVTPEITEDGQGISFHFPSGTDVYFQVWASDSLTSEWTQVRGMTLGEEGTQAWKDATAITSFTGLYYRLRRLPISDPDDYDGDGMDDVFELRHSDILNPRDPSDAYEDFDNDGLANLEECHYGTDPSSADTDGDGLRDGLEIVMATDPFSADTDGDWASDGYEIQQNTDPLDPLSTPEIRLLLNGNTVYSMSSNLAVEIPGLVADYVIFSENTDFQPSITNTFASPLSYSLLHELNEWRNLYALPIRNSSETGNVIFGTILLDTEAPSLTITAPTSGLVTSRRWVRVEGLVGRSTSPLQVHINGFFANGVITGTFYRSKLSLALGTNTIEVVASDAAGNATTQRVEIVQDFTGDTNAPQVHVDLPRDYEIVGGVTNWFDQTTFGEEEILYIVGSVDDETAEVVFIVATEGSTNALVAGDVIGTRVWGRVSLHPGTNALTVLASDAAGNVSTSAYTVIRETNFYFSITNPVAYQVVGSRTAFVSGVASPLLATAAIKVNGVEAQVTDHGTHISFITVEPILLDTHRTAISATAEVNGKSYYADPTVYGYEGLVWKMNYNINVFSGTTPINAGGSGFWSAESGILTGCMYRVYGGPYGWETASTNSWTIQMEPFRWGKGPFFSFNMSHSFGTYMNEDYVWVDRPWNGFGSDSLFYYYWGGITHQSASWDTEIRYIRNWPNPKERSVIFQFINLDYGRKSYEDINPSAVTFLGATGMWYNGNVSFIVSLEPGVEYVMSQQDFTWPPYADTRTDPSWGGLSFNLMGHWLTFSDFTNDILSVDIVPDWNHDREITSADEDQATPSNPFRFWKNDDDDFGNVSQDDSDVPGQGGLFDNANCDDDEVNGRSDLLDFFPVWLDLHDTLNLLPPSGTVQYKLKQANGAVRAVYTDLTKGSAGNFLTTEGNTYGPSFNQNSYEADNFEVTSSGVTLSTDFLDKIKNDATKGILLIEGKSASTAPLVLEVWKDGAKICEKEMPLSVDGVEKFYRWINLRGMAGGGVDRATDTSEPANYPDSYCNGKQFIFVHGYSVHEEAARAWNAEIFKRLYQSGSRAMFTAVTWRGNDGQLWDWIPFIGGSTPDYYVNVEHAFETASNLVSTINASVPGTKYIAGHSLGNMVVSSAIADHGLSVNAYFMLNAAVAMEAYNASFDNRNVIRHSDWQNYDSRLWASEWYQLFTSGDGRNTLRWGDRFGTISSAFNYYSETEDVLNNANGSVPAIGNERAWVNQEMRKGTTLIWLGPGNAEAGWGFNAAYTNADGSYPLLPAAANALTDDNMRTNSFFNWFDDDDLYGTNGSAVAQQPAMHRQLLADAIPALSNPAGRNSIGSAAGQGNRDFMSHGGGAGFRRGVYATGDWPDDDNRWHHSDLKRVAYPYNSKAFDQIVSDGSLK